MTRPLRMGLAILALFLAYLGLRWLEYRHGIATMGMTPLDPSAGLAFAGLLLGGPVFLPAIVCGEIAASLLRDGWPPPVASVLGGLTVAASWGGASLVLRHVADLRLSRQRDLVMLIVVAAGAALISALGDTLIILLEGRLPPRAATEALIRTWTGDMIGVMVVTPLLLVIRRQPTIPSRVMAVEVAAQGLVAITILWLLFWLPSAAELQLYDLLVLPSIWAAARFGIGGAAVINIVLQVGMVAAFITAVMTADEVTANQFRMLVLTLSTLFLGVAVTERRRAEDSLRHRQDQLDRCARLSIAGEMAAALAHDLNQPLSAALTYSRTAQRLLASPTADRDRLRAAMDGAAAQAERAGLIIRTLREFIGRGELKRQRQSVSTLVADSLALVVPECQRTGIRVEVMVDRALPQVLVDSVQVQQVLVNLLRNAVEALESVAGARRQVTIVARMVETSTIEIEVADSGPGLDPDLEGRLFQPFSTTKAAGMGLGLAICRTIIEAHGGRLWLAGSGPEGCAFRFTLPVAVHGNMGER